MIAKRQTPRSLARAFAAAELPALAAVPVAMVALALADVPATAGLTLAVALLSIALMLASFESSRPALRQLMPTAVLAAVAAAGRVLFAPIPDVKPVSAIAIVAGAALGRRSGFVVGVMAALLSNFFFGQGPWTPWQMYAWGLVGYVGGLVGYVGGLVGQKDLVGEKDLPREKDLPGQQDQQDQPCRPGQPGLPGRGAVLYVWGFLSALVYGLVLNGYHVLGYVHPLTWESVLLVCVVSLPLDVTHGVATVAFLAAIWLPWGRAIRRVVAKYGL